MAERYFQTRSSTIDSRWWFSHSSCNTAELSILGRCWIHFPEVDPHTVLQMVEQAQLSHRFWFGHWPCHEHLGNLLLLHSQQYSTSSVVVSGSLLRINWVVTLTCHHRGNTVVPTTMDQMEDAVQVILPPGQTFGPKRW